MIELSELISDKHPLLALAAAGMLYNIAMLGFLLWTYWPGSKSDVGGPNDWVG